MRMPNAGAERYKSGQWEGCAYLCRCAQLWVFVGLNFVQSYQESEWPGYRTDMAGCPVFGLPQLHTPPVSVDVVSSV